MPPTPGTRLGPYEISAQIGAGGMGEVYRARDTKLDRDVAIKILPEAFANDADRLARFQREAKTLASLNNPHIAIIHGLEQAGNVQALVMELVEGEDLSERIARGAIPIEEALPIAQQIAEALEAAHEQGIIHRDLKPANIKVRADGAVKVLDFGLAKAMEPAAAVSPGLSQSPTITTPAMTRMGIILGTAAYMSPEQAKGKAIDKRTDIWAFGCVLYEMLTGKRAFGGEDVSDTLAFIITREPDWSLLPDQVPLQIRVLMQRCLEKDRFKRLSHLAIARFLISEPIVASVPATAAAVHRPVAKRMLPAIISAVFASVLVGVAVWEYRSVPRQPVIRFSFLYGEGQAVTYQGRYSVAISPDGTQIAYTANQRVFLKSSWDVEAREVAGTEGAVFAKPVFSPDGRSIAFFYGSQGGGSPGGPGTLKKIATAGGVPVPLCEVSNPDGMSWDGDSILLGQAGKGILRVSQYGGSPEVLATVKGAETAQSPQMLPDGRTVLYTLANGPDSDIVTQTLGSADRKVLIKGGTDARYLPTGHVVYAVGSVLFAVPIDIRRQQVVGVPVPVVEGVRRAGPAANFAVSQTGSLVYIPWSAAMALSRDVGLLDRNGVVERLKLPPGAYEFPRVSPNGHSLALGINDPKQAYISIYDLSRATPIRRLTFEGNNRYPTWTADSASVAFQSDREGDRAIFWQRADGTDSAERLTTAEQGEAHVPESWSPSGDSLLFRGDRGSTQRLLMFSLKAGKTMAFDSVPASSVTPNAAFSPDGHWVAYATLVGDRQSVLVQPFPPTGTPFPVAAGNNPFWAPDGKELFYSIGAGPLFTSSVNVNTQGTFTVTNPTAVPRPDLIVRPTDSRGRNYDVAPDGRRFVIIVNATDSPTDVNSNPHIEVVLNWFEELRERVPVR